MKVEFRTKLYGFSHKDGKKRAIINAALILSTETTRFSLDIVGVRVQDGVVMLPGAISNGRFFRMISMNGPLLAALVDSVRKLLEQEAPDMLPLRELEHHEHANRPTVVSIETLASYSPEDKQ